jgi:hypothetical protein
MSPARPISQSRSRSREPVHASGRGGAGNIHVGGPTETVIEEMDESERAAHHLAPGVCVLFSFLFQNAEHLTRSFLLCCFF